MMPGDLTLLAVVEVRVRREPGALVGLGDHAGDSVVAARR
jgi:hypothetical protein